MSEGFPLGYDPNPLRARYSARKVREVSQRNGKDFRHSWVGVFEREPGGAERLLGEFEVPAYLTGPFEPFAQGGRHYALYCPMYDRLAVMELPSMRTVWAEPEWDLTGEPPPGHVGLCPLDLYVPRSRPDHFRFRGETYVDEVDGQFGFVTGRYWGAEGWNPIWYLDLSRVSEGVVTQDLRFGEHDSALPLEQAVDLWQYTRADPCVRINWAGTYRLNAPARRDLQAEAASLIEEVRAADPEKGEELQLKLARRLYSLASLGSR